ncbi:DUF7344 domain-containing protein [Halosimplex amylolyticum]|uniref:DUF7344 domain-containing protein n=1 Tax=Halosimplex amylolyticum TaxID=3396616 RepID=UPI003F55BE0B
MPSESDQRASEMIERWNHAFRALTAEPRRQIVVALMEAPPGRQLSLPEAANPPYQLRDPEDLYVDLVHTHLPMLAERGFVEWEREPLTVERGPAFEEVQIVFEALHAHASELPPQLVQECQRLEESARGQS